MAYFEYLGASDGTGEAVLAHITANRLVGSMTLKVDNLENWPNYFILTTGTPNANGYITASSMTQMLAHKSGADIIIDSFEPGYTDTGNTTDQIAIIKQTTGFANRVQQAVQATEQFIVNNADWRPVAATITGVTYNGNGSYTLGTSGDLRSTLSPGMRLRTTRTAAIPTRGTELTLGQSWTDTTLTGLSQTDDVSLVAHLKIDTYKDQALFSNRSGANGWDVLAYSNGSVRVHAVLSAGNHKLFQTTSSHPLGRKFHLGVTLDMSGNVAKITFDGIEQPYVTAHSGTANSFTPAPTLNIGTDYAGATFAGKIWQLGTFSTVLTTATIRNYSTYSLTGTEPNCIGLWKFDGNGNDSTANANHLVAVGGAVATSVGVPFGTQADGTNSQYDYAIIHKVTDTALIVQVPEGCTIPVSGGISALAYSSVKVPYNFPSDVGRWTLVYSWGLGGPHAAAGGSWAPIPQITATVPLGKWVQDSHMVIAALSTTAAAFAIATEWNTVTPTSHKINRSYARQNSGTGSYLVIQHRHPEFLDIPATITNYQLYAVISGGGGTVEAYIEPGYSNMLYLRNAYL